MPSIPGCGLQGFMPAMDYLTEATRCLLDDRQPAAALDAMDKDVFIVGQGDTANDCVATAVRQGARSITQLYYRAQPPLERPANNSWPLYPRVLKTDYGQIEYAQTYGKDPREYLVDLTGVVGDAQDRVSAVRISKVEWVSVNGRSQMQHIEGTEELRPAQMVLIATGYAGPEDTLVKALSLETTGRNTVKTPEGGYDTSAHAVFTAGDMRRGQSLVVWAIREGRDAAQQCHEFLTRKK
jgi:glutamate synthase (NADPH/NADH) small chain